MNWSARSRYTVVLWRMSCHASGVVGSVLGLVGPRSVYCGTVVLWRLSCHTSGVIGSVLGLVGPQSVYCGTVEAVLPHIWCYRVNAGTGRPAVSMLWYCGPARQLVLQGQCWDWPARSQCTVTENVRQFEQQELQSELGSLENCLADPCPRCTLHVAGAFATEQQTN